MHVISSERRFRRAIKSSDHQFYLFGFAIPAGEVGCVRLNRSRMQLFSQPALRPANLCLRIKTVTAEINSADEPVP
jgi:hypothetical protein